MHIALFIIDLIVLGALGGAGYYGYLIARRLPTGSPPALDGSKSEAVALRGQELSALRDGLRSVEHAFDGRLERVERDLIAQHEETRRRLVALLADRPADELAADERRRERQREVLTDLYRRLAKIEVSIAAVTNPIQLPGEPYTVPTEFLPDTLRWENWKDVGESAFAFADAFNGCRLDLDDDTIAELAAFVTALRTCLTGAVYPNLQPRPSSEQLQALKSGLNQIGRDLAATRARIEQAYRGDNAEPAPTATRRA